MVLLSVVVCSVLLAAAAATEVEQCPDQQVADLSQNVELTPCPKLPCKLKKGIDQHITIKFVPEKDFKSINNKVWAEIFGIPLPFIGVDGSSVCDKIETEDGKKASCPVKAGTTYIYKDSFPVLAIYPDIKAATVHWALTSNNHDITCFQVPIKIVK